MVAAPENVLIYHAGTGRIVFLGMLRTATIFVAGVSSMIIAPAFFADEFPSYLAPLSMSTLNFKSIDIILTDFSCHRRRTPTHIRCIYHSPLREQHLHPPACLCTQIARSSARIRQKSPLDRDTIHSNHENHHHPPHNRGAYIRPCT